MEDKNDGSGCLPTWIGTNFLAPSPLYIELHKHLFAPESDTFGGLNEFFGDPFRSAAVLEVQGTALRTMHPCEHLNYLIFHAF